MTIADVAAQAGVGAGTVSRVLNEQPQGQRHRPAPASSPPSRRSTTGPTRWPRACPAAAARRSASSSPSSPTPRPSSGSAASSPALDGSRYDLVLFNVESPVHRDEHLASLTRRDRADGLLVVSMPPPPAELGRLERRRRAGRAARRPLARPADGRHRRRRGRPHRHPAPARRSATSASPSSATTPTTRSGSPPAPTARRGYREAMAAAGVAVDESLVRHGPHVRDVARRLAEQLPGRHGPADGHLRRRPTSRPSACSRRARAARARRARRPLGHRLRRHRAVSAYVGLTTVRQPLFESGRSGGHACCWRRSAGDRPRRARHPRAAARAGGAVHHRAPADGGGREARPQPTAAPPTRRAHMKRTRSMRWRAGRPRWPGLALSLLARGLRRRRRRRRRARASPAAATERRGRRRSPVRPRGRGRGCRASQDSFTAFEEETGITIEYSGDRSFEEQIGGQVDGGDPPDIAMFPQPGKISDFAGRPRPARPTTSRHDGRRTSTRCWTDLVTIDGDRLRHPGQGRPQEPGLVQPGRLRGGGLRGPRDAWTSSSPWPTR